MNISVLGLLCQTASIEMFFLHGWPAQGAIATVDGMPYDVTLIGGSITLTTIREPSSFVLVGLIALSTLASSTAACSTRVPPTAPRRELLLPRREDSVRRLCRSTKLNLPQIAISRLRGLPTAHNPTSSIRH
jgi:hypothetical protein